MDPDQTLEEILQAMSEHKYEEAAPLMDGLENWLNMRGAQPAFCLSVASMFKHASAWALGRIEAHDGLEEFPHAHYEDADAFGAYRVANDADDAIPHPAYHESVYTHLGHPAWVRLGKLLRRLRTT